MVPCPCCGGQLEIIGSRLRKRILSTGEIQVLSIRRLRCTNCGRIHHELPHCLVPYKRYDSECVESVLSSEPETVVIAADDSTLARWRKWFRDQETYFLGCLQSISLRLNQAPVERASSSPSPSVHHRIGRFVGDQLGWLSKVVRSLGNFHLWVHTRSAFLSTPPFGTLKLPST